MARAKAYRRKNRRLELTVDVPAEFLDDEDFLNGLADRMDGVEWQFIIPNDDEDIIVPINRIKIGDVEIDGEGE